MSRYLNTYPQDNSGNSFIKSAQILSPHYVSFLTTLSKCERCNNSSDTHNLYYVTYHMSHSHITPFIEQCIFVFSFFSAITRNYMVENFPYLFKTIARVTIKLCYEAGFINEWVHISSQLTSRACSVSFPVNENTTYKCHPHSASLL